MMKEEQEGRSPTVRSLGGARVPSPGFGTYGLKGRECRFMVEKALELGYRHFDTAESYGNEGEVGEALFSSRLNRRDIFLTSKVSPRHFGEEELRKAVRGSLKRLKTDALDLLLLHWPAFRETSLASAVEALNKAQQEGLTKHIGVSNFTADLLEDARTHTSSPLVANQVEYHPFLDQDALLGAMEEMGVLLTAYCPVARGRTAENPVLKQIGEAHGKTGPQVALRWLVQRGAVPLPRSSDPAHAEENLNIYDFHLSSGEMEKVHDLHDPRGRIIDPSDHAPQWD